MVKQVRRYDIYLANLDPARGSEIQKMRPCVVISPDEMNQYVRTVVMAPMTSTRRDCPSRVNVTFQRKKGQVVLDQIRTVDKSRLLSRLGVLPDARAREVASVLREMFAYDS